MFPFDFALLAYLLSTDLNNVLGYLHYRAGPGPGLHSASQDWEMEDTPPLVTVGTRILVSHCSQCLVT